jgi:hypothetical protein
MTNERLLPDDHYFVFPDTSKLILRAGEVLCGDSGDWMERLAELLSIRTDTVRQYAIARRTPPVDIVRRLVALVERRRDEAAVLRDRLSDAAGRMVCPLCGDRLEVLHRSGKRLIECTRGHFFQESEGPPFGSFVEKQFEWTRLVRVRLTAHGRHVQPDMAYTIRRHCEEELGQDLVRVKALREPAGLTLDFAFDAGAADELLAGGIYLGRIRTFLERYYPEIAPAFFEAEAEISVRL